MNHADATAVSWEEMVDAALGACSTSVKRSGTARWQFTLDDERTVQAMIDGHYLVFHGALPAGLGCLSVASAWAALQLNTALPPRMRLERFDDDGAIIRADLLLYEEMEWSTAVGAICDRYREVWTTFMGRAGPAVAGAWALPGDGRLEIRPLVSEAGWKFVERAGGKLAVELEVDQGFYQALMEPAGGAVSLRCELVEGRELSPSSQEALGVLLLRVSRRVHGLRPSVVVEGDTELVVFETTIARAPVELTAALEAFSVGCSLCGEETKMLQDELLARRYLEFQGRVAGDKHP